MIKLKLFLIEMLELEKDIKKEKSHLILQVKKSFQSFSKDQIFKKFLKSATEQMYLDVCESFKNGLEKHPTANVCIFGSYNMP